MTWAPRDGRRRTASFILVVLVFLLTLALSGCASVEQRLRRAAQLEERGEYAAALDAYQDAISHINANDRTKLAETSVRIGECLWRLERPNDSLNAFERALELIPPTWMRTCALPRSTLRRRRDVRSVRRDSSSHCSRIMWKRSRCWARRSLPPEK